MSSFFKSLARIPEITSAQLWISSLVIVGIFFFMVYPVAREGDISHRHDLDVVVGDIVLKTERADTPQKRTRGLSGRPTLNADEAMLFIFERPGHYTFHMPDMYFPIDIFWLDAEKRVVFIKKYASLEDYPEVYVPSESALYVLETVSGFADTHGVTVGTEFSW